MALSKVWTLKKVKDVLRILVNEIAPDKVQQLSLDDYINLAVADVAEMLSEASQPDYGACEVLVEANSRKAARVSGGTYANSTKTITKTSHGFTTSDIGKLCIINDGNTNYFGVGAITGITSADAFTVNYTHGGDIASNLYYAVVAGYSLTYVTLSSLASSVDKIIKVTSSAYGLIPEKKDMEFENLTNLTQYANTACYNQFGDKLFLFIGSSLAGLGTVSIYYYRQPTPVSSDTDYIDVKDKYIPLIIAKAKNYVYEQLGSQPPESLTNLIDQKTQAIRALNLNETQAIKARATTKGQ